LKKIQVRQSRAQILEREELDKQLDGYLSNEQLEKLNHPQLLKPNPTLRNPVSEDKHHLQEESKDNIKVLGRRNSSEVFVAHSEQNSKITTFSIPVKCPNCQRLHNPNLGIVKNINIS
jgi:hypothetical protein